jgi:hypothetical protein
MGSKLLKANTEGGLTYPRITVRQLTLINNPSRRLTDCTGELSGDYDPTLAFIGAR